MNKLVAIMFQKITFLTNPAGYLDNSGSGSFDNLKSTLQNVLADMYGLLVAVGFGLLGCALVAAFILFGVMKDNNTIKENKQWILRLILAATGIACVLTIIGIAAGIGEKIK